MGRVSVLLKAKINSPDKRAAPRSHEQFMREFDVLPFVSTRKGRSRWLM